MQATCRVPVGLLLWVALAGPALAQAGARDSERPTYLLRYKFQPGETLRWNVLHRNRVRTTVSGTTQTAETVSKSVKVWRVTGCREDGTATFAYSVESVDMWQKLTGRQEARYNSKTDKQAPPGFESVAQSVGVPLSQITMDATGEIVSRERNKAVQSAESEGQITIPLPDEAVPVGHTWSFPHQIDLPLPDGTVKKIKSMQKFTLLEVKTGVATIEVATQILTPIHDPAIEIAPDAR